MQDIEKMRREEECRFLHRRIRERVCSVMHNEGRRYAGERLVIVSPQHAKGGTMPSRTPSTRLYTTSHIPLEEFVHGRIQIVAVGLGILGKVLLARGLVFGQECRGSAQVFLHSVDHTQPRTARTETRFLLESSSRWKGQHEHAQEWVVEFKTRQTLYADLEQAIISEHSYETPEIVATPIVSGSNAFLQWINQETFR